MPTTCHITGYLYDTIGTIIKAGTISLRLQQDITSVDGYKVVPVIVEQSLEPLAAPVILSIGTAGTPGSTSYYYEVTAVDGLGGESLLSNIMSIATANATLSGVNYTGFSWTPVIGALTYNVYGRGSSSGGRILLSSTSNTSYLDQGAVIGTAKPTTNTSGGYIDLRLVPTVGASPAGVAYYVQYDPDPADTSMPARSKDGYWHNYWAVPDLPSIPVGDFVSALRGTPSASYMPLSGTVAALNDGITLGSATDTTKSISAPQVGFTPKIRFNAATDKWELSNDGTTFDEINISSVVGDITSVIAGNGLSGGGTSGPVTLNVEDIVDADISASAAIAWSKIAPGFIPYGRIPIDGTSIFLNGSNQLSGVPMQGVPTGCMLINCSMLVPTGYLNCDGVAVSRTTYATLFAAIGTTYGGGDGTTTFNLPAMQERMPMGRSNPPLDVLGGMGGSVDHTHTFTDVPNHTHPVNVTDPGHVHNVQRITAIGGGTTMFENNSSGNTSMSVPTSGALTGITATTSNPPFGVTTVTTNSSNPPYILLHFVIKT